MTDPKAKEAAFTVLRHLAFSGVPSPYVDENPESVCLIWAHPPVDAIATVDGRGLVDVVQSDAGTPPLKPLISMVARLR